MSGLDRWMPDHLSGFHDVPRSWAAGARGEVDPLPDPAPAVLRELRDIHFAGGLCCPRCRSPRVQRWGTFSGRQRYRCLGCGRTSSDLTGTPLAYSKRPELWGEFAGCMLESLSVRAAGRRLGIDKDTAWRWRHALIEAHATRADPVLEGIVEACERGLSFNRKGERLEWREWPRRRRRRYGAPNRKRVWILFGHDRAGHAAALVSLFRRPGRTDLTELLRRRHRGVHLLLPPNARYVPNGAFAQSLGIASARVAARAPLRGTLLHLQNVLGYQGRFRNWLRRFRGVATWYLPNYLYWFSVLDRLARPATSMLLAACRGRPPLVSRRGRGDAAHMGIRANAADPAKRSFPHSSGGQCTETCGEEPSPKMSPPSDPSP